MSSTEKEVAFRKRRRDYVLNKPKNAIRANTKIVHEKQDKFIRPETILARARQTKADKKKYNINNIIFQKRGRPFKVMPEIRQQIEELTTEDR